VRERVIMGEGREREWEGGREEREREEGEADLTLYLCSLFIFDYGKIFSYVAVVSTIQKYL
jgi:hypothetical protein